MNKKIILVMLGLLLIPSLAFARGAMMMQSGGTTAVASSYCDTKSGYLLCEDFEGASSCASGYPSNNCRNTWVESSGNPCQTDPVFDTTSGALAGTYSVFQNESAGYAYCIVAKDYTAGGTINAYARVKFGVMSIASGNATTLFGLMGIFSGSNPSGDRCWAAIKNDGGTYKFAAATTDYNVCTSDCPTPQINTEYHVWIEFVKNTSCSVYVSTTSTKPASPTAQDTDGVPNLDAGTLVLVSADATDDLDEKLYDNILVDDATIGGQ